MKLLPLVCITVVSVTSAVASADSLWSVKLGYFHPTGSVSQLQLSDGEAFGVAYRAYHHGMTTVEVESFATSSQVNEAPGFDGTGTSFQSTVGQLNVSLTQAFANGLYGGVGIGIASSSSVGGADSYGGTNSSIGGIFSLMAGYNLSSRTFLEARYTTGRYESFKGISALVGFRI